MKIKNLLNWRGALILIIIIASMFLLADKCNAQNVTVKYIENVDSTFQKVTTTTYQNGEFVAIGGQPITSEDYADYLFEATENKGIERDKNRKLAAKDSIEYEEIKVQYEQQSGKTYAEKLADYYEKNFQGDWKLIIRNDSTTTRVDLVFENGKFKFDDEKLPVKGISKTAFCLRKLEEKQIIFELQSAEKWTAKTETANYVLKKL
jgi:hypothetical protein